MDIKQKQQFLEKLYIEHAEWLHSLARRHLNNYELARDVVQEVFLIAQTKIDDLIVHENPVGWLCLTTYYAADRERRKLCHKDVPLAEHDHTMQFAQPDIEPRLAELLPDDFGDDEKKLLVLRYEEEYSYSEIADLCDMSQANCRQKMSRLRKKLKKIYEKPKTLSQSASIDR